MEVKSKAKEKIRDRGRPVQKEWQKKSDRDGSVSVKNVFDCCRRFWMSMMTGSDKIVYDTLVENGKSVAYLEVDTLNIGAGLTLSDSEGITVQVQQVPVLVMLTKRVPLEDLKMQVVATNEQRKVYCHKKLFLLGRIKLKSVKRNDILNLPRNLERTWCRLRKISLLVGHLQGCVNEIVLLEFSQIR